MAKLLDPIEELVLNYKCGDAGIYLRRLRRELFDAKMVSHTKTQSNIRDFFGTEE